MTISQISHYQVKQILGTGGRSIVYLAHDARFGRNVAIKVLNQNVSPNSPAQIEFEQEVKIVAQLQHPAIVPVYDFGLINNNPYIVMPYMAGGTLEDKIHQQILSYNDLIAIVQRICSALDAIHGQNIVHRDIKPGNILLDNYNNAYLADFGTARFIQQSQMTSRFVTFEYASPEQLSNQKIIDARTDIYQMGVVIFEMLTGRLPFLGNDPSDYIYHHLYTPIPLIRQINYKLPSSLQIIFDKSLEKTIEKRFTSASALSIAFDQAIRKISSPLSDIVSYNVVVPTTRASYIAKTTTTLLTPVIKQAQIMSNGRLAILIILLLAIITILTFSVGKYIQVNHPYVWMFFSSFYFISGIIAYIISRRGISIFIVHTLTHILVSSIIYYNYLDVQLLSDLVLSGIISSGVLWYIVRSRRLPEQISYPLSITAAYAISFLYPYFSALERPEGYTIIGAIIVGYLGYFISEVYKGIRKAQLSINP